MGGMPIAQLGQPHCHHNPHHNPHPHRPSPPAVLFTHTAGGGGGGRGGGDWGGGGTAGEDWMHTAWRKWNRMNILSY